MMGQKNTGINAENTSHYIASSSGCVGSLKCIESVSALVCVCKERGGCIFVMSSLVIDLCDSDDSDYNPPNSLIFKSTLATFFKDYPVKKKSEKDAELNDLLVANCNTLKNMKKNIFPDIYSFIDAAGLRVEESLDGFFAKSGACQFASIAYHLYPDKPFEEKFRPDRILREIAVNVIAANKNEYHQYLEPAVVHLRTRSTRKAGGHSIDIKQYLDNMTKQAVDGDS